LFANSIQDLQNSLDLPYEYCYKWKLHVNVAKTKIMIFRKGLSDNISVKYGDQELEIINRFVYMYLGIVFTAGGSFSDTQSTLVGQALKAIFKLNKCLYKFKYLLRVKKCTQNDFVYGELGRCPMRNYRMYIVKYWTQIILCDTKRYI